MKRKSGANLGQAMSKRYRKDTVPERLKKVEKSVRTLKSGAERKISDVTNVSQTVAWDTNTAFRLVETAQGDGVLSERVGDAIECTKLHIRGRFRMNASDTNGATCRMIIVRCKQRFVPASNTGSTTSTAVLKDGGLVSAAYSAIDWQNRDHFEVIYDKLFSMGTTAGDGGIKTFDFQYVVPPSKRELRYNLVGSGGDVVKGMYWIITTSDKAISGTPPTTAWQCRTYYTDK